ncbi:MAG: hypothetical protein K8R91_03985 [Phycisphaerae bacterium]|nr:hypothetical protein [Phycisphaerae bacterium]
MNEKWITPVVLLVLILMAFLPQTASAQYHSQGELPGIETETIIIGALVAVAVIIVVHQATKEAQETEGGEYAPPDSTDYSLPETIFRMRTYPGSFSDLLNANCTATAASEETTLGELNPRLGWQPIIGNRGKRILLGVRINFP